MTENRYFKRDLSWLAFNHRVLQEAQDERNPLFERIKFLAIYSANLDEFFRVRVASLRSFRKLKKKERKELELEVKPRKELREIRQIVGQQQRLFGHIFREQILPALQEQGIYLVPNEDFSPAQQAFARDYFAAEIASRLQPQPLDLEGEPPFLKNKALYFVIAGADETPPALLELPADLPRFIPLPAAEGVHAIAFLDDIIRFNLEAALGRPVLGAYAVKLSRDADLYIEDEFSGDLVEKIRQSLAVRHIGLPTRFLYDQAMPPELLASLKTYFGLNKNDLIPGARYHNFNDFFSFPNPTGKAELHDEPWAPLPHPALEKAPSILRLLHQQDAVLHFPYQKFDYVTRFIEEAADDPKVENLKITLYRAASRSAIMAALLKACRQGKAVTAFIEAKARFDEESNLEWGNALAQAGASVHYSYPGIKVHTKLLLIQRREGQGLRNYAYLGTGNFNENTARIYTDHGLLTADPRLADEAAQVFSLLERRIILPQCEHLLVSPFTTRAGFTALLLREIDHARQGLPAYAILKMNSLEDPGMIDKLYEASQAGVEIQLIIRGICCLLPGVEGLSENIAAISIVGRYLEHARVYIFANAGQEEMYIASADWMGRNLDRRVEACFPVYDPEVFRQVRHIIELQLQDEAKARWIDAEQRNLYKSAGDGAEPAPPALEAQAAIYRFLRDELGA
jgi:polyphosphate kinase